VAENLYPVQIGEMAVSANPAEVLVVYGLGSCVAICLYDPVARVGGMLHALLPGHGWSKNGHSEPARFVDQGVPLLIEALTALGAKPSRLTAKLCGGAQMVTVSDTKRALNIGEYNVLAAKHALRAASLRLAGKVVGGRQGRTVKLYIATGQVTVKTMGQEKESPV
jgi:chemotaxis protein CheD